MSARIAVLASGGGTNLQALLDYFDARGSAQAASRVALVISDRADAGALERARRAGVATKVIAGAGRAEPDVAHELLDALTAAEIDLVALAGYIRLVPTEVVRHFPERMLNIHPALLPAFGGKGMYGRRVHEAVLAAGCRVSGVTVHFINEVYDAGRILLQWPVPVLPGDTPESLAARVLRVEHRAYPVAVEAVARGRAQTSALPDLPVGDALMFRLSEEPPSVDELRNFLGLT